MIKLTPRWAIDHLKKIHSRVIEDIDTLGALDILETLVEEDEKAHNSESLIEEK